MSKQKSFFILVILMVPSMAHAKVTNSLSLGFGPLWLMGWGDLRYGINAVPESKGRSFYSTDFNALPSLEGKWVLTLGNYFFIYAKAQAGWGNNLRAVVKTGILSPSIRTFGEQDMLFNCSLVAAKGGAGAKFRCTENFLLALAAGYLFEEANFANIFIQPLGELDVIHTFQGPIFTLEADIELSEKISVAPHYSFSFGRLTGAEHSVHSDDLLSSNSPCISSILGIETKYHINNHWTAGINATFVNLLVTKPVKAHLSPGDALILNNAILEAAGSNVFILLGFIECTF